MVEIVRQILHVPRNSCLRMRKSYNNTAKGFLHNGYCALSTYRLANELSRALQELLRSEQHTLLLAPDSPMKAL